MSMYIEKHGEEVKDGDRGKAIQGERKKGQYSFFTYLTIITIIKKNVISNTNNNNNNKQPDNKQNIKTATETT